MREHSSFSRRAFLRGAALTSGAMVTGGATDSASQQTSSASVQRPNVLMICADQFRADFVGANRANPSVKTPNIDALANRGTNFCQAVCNQPLCSPSRASFLTSVTATEANVWRLGLELNHSLPTIATALKAQGYTTAFYGKWHLAATNGEDGVQNKSAATDDTAMGHDNPRGFVPAGPQRAGFDDVFEGANAPEIVSHPYQGNYWDTGGNNIGYRAKYRADFITERSIKFLEQKHDKPWLLFVSQLEPHQQNDVDMMVPPKRYADSYADPFVPHDLRNLPGNWRSRLPGYYGCVQAIDDCVGQLVDALTRTAQLENTIIVFFSDHGCTFRTRLGEYKRSPHESSLRIPLITAGPGFDRSRVVNEVVSLIDLVPTLLDGAGIAASAGMKGRSLKKLADDPAARSAWDSRVYIQISSSICGRAIRTKEWTYCAYDPSIPNGRAEFSKNYMDFALYSLSGDPYQQVNLVGRPEYKLACAQLREELRQMIIENGEPEPTISPVLFYA